MSEFLAEARILVRPDTTKFRALLETELAAVTAKPIVVPITPVVAGGGVGALTAETNAFTTAQVGAAAETQAVAAALEKETIAATAATEAQTAHVRSVSQLGRGAAASGLSLLGLRGATLAASGAFLAGTAAVVGFAKAVQSAASLQTELNVFRVTAGATADEMTRVSDEAKALGRDLTLPGVTANDAAVALTELAKAGLSVQDSLAGARGALQLATAAQIDNVTATKLVAGALNTFQLSGTQAVKVADLLTGAAKESQGEITDMAGALAQVGAVAKQFGVSIGDTVTLITELAQAGLSGGRAGTSLRVAFLRLINPTQKAADELARLGVAVRDANGNLRPTVFTDITEALQGYSKAQRDAALATIFGSDAIRAAAIIGNKGVQAFLQTSAAINEVGLAQQQAAARTQGLQGSFENLSNQVSALGLTIGQVSTGPVNALVKSLADLVSQMTLAANGAVSLGKGFKDFSDRVDSAIPILGTFDKHLGDIAKIGSLLSPLTFQLKLASELSKKFGDNAAASTTQTDAYGNSIEGVAKSVGDLGVQLRQSAADSKVFTQQVTTATAQLLQSAADSRVNLSKLGQQPVATAQQGLRTKQIENIIGGFDAKAVRDRIAGDNKQLLADLQAEQDFLQAQLRRQFVKNRPALKRQLEQNLLGVVTDIDTIQKQAQSKADKVQSDAKAAADKAAKAATAREQALLASFGVARDQRQNKIAQAAQTAGLQDDIKQQNLLKALVLKQIAAVRERISIEGGRAAAITALRAILVQIAAAQKALVTQQNAAKAQQRADLLAGIGLDISLDQIQQNQNKEIADRRKLIVQLNKDLAAEAKLHGTTTLRYKEIRNQIAEQNAAIAAITAEKKKQNNALGQAAFEFLQAQQGFASNLLGNLIPSGATAGLVGGGGAPVAAAITPVASAADARSQTGFTAGQGNAVTHVLGQILQVLKQINGAASAPEAARQWQTQRNTMDGVGGG